MTEIVKNGVILAMPPMDKTAMVNMERFAEFMARMIHKYGAEVLADIEAENKAKAKQG